MKMKTNEQLILEAANKVFKEKGYDGTTVHSITGNKTAAGKIVLDG